MFSFWILSIFLLVLLQSILITCKSIQCLDENGKPVDWFVVYKLPKVSSPSSILKAGTSYMYITPDSLANGWTQSKIPIVSEKSIFARTLSPLYGKQTEQNIWLTYNDQAGMKVSSKYGHTKGVIAANKQGGFWLIHSVPHFPVVGNEYTYPLTGHTFGQSALCITLEADQIDILGEALMYNRPNIFQKKISHGMDKIFPKLISAINGVSITEAPWSMSANLYTMGSRNFTLFAKAGKFNKDLYEWVASTLKTNLLVETWRNVLVPLSSSCSRYKVLNVEKIKLEHPHVTFSSHKDHSKWAISKSNTTPWVCIGDINRVLHQEKRGGGTVCLQDKNLWQAYHQVVAATSHCK